MCLFLRHVELFCFYKVWSRWKRDVEMWSHCWVIIWGFFFNVGGGGMLLGRGGHQGWTDARTWKRRRGGTKREVVGVDACSCSAPAGLWLPMLLNFFHMFEVTRRIADRFLIYEEIFYVDSISFFLCPSSVSPDAIPGSFIIICCAAAHHEEVDDKCVCLCTPICICEPESRFCFLYYFISSQDDEGALRPYLKTQAQKVRVKSARRR